MGCARSKEADHTGAVPADAPPGDAPPGDAPPAAEGGEGKKMTSPNPIIGFNWLPI